MWNRFDCNLDARLRAREGNHRQNLDYIGRGQARSDPLKTGLYVMIQVSPGNACLASEVCFIGQRQFAEAVLQHINTRFNDYSEEVTYLSRRDTSDWMLRGLTKKNSVGFP
jgi:hypothetical protein